MFPFCSDVLYMIVKTDGWTDVEKSEQMKGTEGTMEGCEIWIRFWTLESCVQGKMFLCSDVFNMQEYLYILLERRGERTVNPPDNIREV